jgi:hypothetical protein
VRLVVGDFDPVEVRGCFPDKGGCGAGVEVVEVLIDGRVDFEEEREVVDLFVEFVAAVHEDEENEAEGAHEAGHLYSWVKKGVPWECTLRLLSRRRPMMTMRPSMR